jgi:hypothetical protein
MNAPVEQQLILDDEPGAAKELCRRITRATLLNLAEAGHDVVEDGQGLAGTLYLALIPFMD